MSDLSFEVEAVIPATPEQIWDAWLSSEGHAAITGAPAEASAEVGGAFSAWDGYIRGHNRELERPGRIVQDWRTAEFGDDEVDSRLTVTLEAVDGGTRVRIRHERLPRHGGQYEQGWIDHYFEPMTAHFGG
jgi:uncharacterized protein YndB with AHSA1/START domain